VSGVRVFRALQDESGQRARAKETGRTGYALRPLLQDPLKVVFVHVVDPLIERARRVELDDREPDFVCRLKRPAPVNPHQTDHRWVGEDGEFVSKLSFALFGSHLGGFVLVDAVYEEKRTGEGRGGSSKDSQHRLSKEKEERKDELLRKGERLASDSEWVITNRTGRTASIPQ
jgi:hypothetical protein